MNTTYTTSNNNSGAIENLRTRRCRLFDEEKCRQLKENSSKLEKIKVELETSTTMLKQDPILLLMNKNISTPADCAKRLFIFDEIYIILICVRFIEHRS